jgi:signal transduction histidine kinase
MKRKLNLILIPITVAIFGIMYFQVDWMIKTYRTEVIKINKGSNMALAMAISHFKTEQRIKDSLHISNNLRKWVDTVKMKYNNTGDSLHIDLEYQHPTIEHPTIQTGYYMHVSLSAPEGVSIMSPGILSNGKVGPSVNAANERNIRLNDSVERFFQIFVNREVKKQNEAFATDTGIILKYFKIMLKKYDVTDPVENLPILAFPNTSAGLMGHDDIHVIEFSQNIFHRYNDTRYAVSYFPGQSRWIIKQIALRAGISVALILILIFSFGYLIQIIKQQKQLADIKDDFIDNLTHEFKTPIATISAAIEGMQKFNALEDKEKTNRYLEISKNELTRLNDMVTKLLNISVYDKNNLTLTLHNVNLDEMIDDIVSMEKFRAVKPVQFNVDINESVTQLPADPLHFKNALINLVDNAVKYSKDAVTISITGTAEKGFARIVIKDNGIGIPANQIKNIFDKFYRVPTGDMHNVKGSGLGLSYVRSVIEAHGGTITVNSEINVQTEFIISIPLT